MYAKANAMCLLNRTELRGLLAAAALLLGWNAAHAQVLRSIEPLDLPAQNATAEDLDAYRQVWLQATNQRLGLGAPLRPTGPSLAPSLGLTHRLQLSHADPAYVPWRVAPPNSSLAGLFSQYQYGGSSFHLGGDSHILISPNDPWNGWGRRGVSLLGTIVPNTGVLPNYFMLPGRLGPMW